MKDQFSKYFTKQSLIKYSLFALLFALISYFSIVFILKQFKGVNFSNIHIFSLNAIMIMVLLMFIYVFIDSLRTYFILRALNERISFGYTYLLAFINIFISTITPFSMGGSFATIYLLYKKGLSVGKAAAVTSLKSILASSLNMLIAPIALFFVTKSKTVLTNPAALNQALLFFPLFFIGYILLLVLLFRALKHTSKINHLFHRIFTYMYHRKWMSADRYKQIYTHTSEQITQFASNVRDFFAGAPRFIILSIIATILYYLALYLFSVVMVMDLKLGIPTLIVMAYQSIATLIMYLGVTPGASGFAEGGYAYLFSKIVNNDIQLAALTFYWRLFTTHITSIIGALLLGFELYRIRRKK